MLDRVLRAIEHAERRAAKLAEPDWLLYQTILKEIQMQETQNWTERYYSTEAVMALRERDGTMTPESWKEIGAKWHALYDDISNALDRSVPPDSAEGRVVVARWMRLVDEFTLGNPEVNAGLGRLYADQSQWPDDMEAAKLKSQMPKPEYLAFFHAAMSACLRHG